MTDFYTTALVKREHKIEFKKCTFNLQNRKFGRHALH